MWKSTAEIIHASPRYAGISRKSRARRLFSAWNSRQSIVRDARAIDVQLFQSWQNREYPRAFIRNRSAQQVKLPKLLQTGKLSNARVRKVNSIQIERLEFR